MPRKNSYITVSDQFCGAGGSSQGARRLGLEVKLAMNHWKLAIETHNTNFPETHHECADISATDPRRYWPTDILITSPECTAHSLANGKKKPSPQLSLFEPQQIDPADERSRATAWDVVRFAEVHDYNLIVVENVLQFRSKWILFDDWLRAMHTLGYDHQIVYLNSMFAHMRPLPNPKHGDFAPQSRDRLYIVFWKRGNKKPDLEIRPLAHCHQCGKDVEATQYFKPTPTTRRFGGRWGAYGTQYIYICPTCSTPRQLVEVRPYFYAAANAIDWSLPAERIADRKRPLKERTLTRIEGGLRRFAGQHLIVDVCRNYGDDGRSVPIYSAMPTQTSAQTGALLMLPFTVETLFPGERAPRSVEEALATQTARQSTAVVTPPFILGYANQDAQPRGVDEPLRTFHTENGQGLVMPPFITYLRGTNAPKGMDEGLDTIAASGNHHALVTPFLMSYYGSNGNQRGIDAEMGTVTAVDRHALVQPGQPVQVDDCGFRMLTPAEIGRGMAFDDHYIVLGNNRDKVKQYGNAVTPVAMELLLERCVASLA